MASNNSLNESTVIKNYTIHNSILKLEQVADVNKLIDQITDGEFNQDERLPYWAELWPAAHAMAEYILKNPENFKNKKILELGCGIGLVGIAAAKTGADVIFSDYESEALKFAKNNYFLNFKKQAKTLLLDWRKPSENKIFNTIIAADILYEDRFLAPVYKTLQKMLVTGGKVYIAEPDRSVAKPFFKLMENGFQLNDKMTINIQLEKKLSVSLYIYKKC